MQRDRERKARYAFTPRFAKNHAVNMPTMPAIMTRSALSGSAEVVSGINGMRIAGSSFPGSVTGAS
jgi:hypothetical protein